MKKMFMFTVLFCLIVEQTMASVHPHLNMDAIINSQPRVIEASFGDVVGFLFFVLLVGVVFGGGITIMIKTFAPKKEDPHGHGGHGHDSHGSHGDNHGHDKKHDDHKDHKNHSKDHNDRKKHDDHGSKKDDHSHGNHKPAQKSRGYNHHDNDNTRRFSQKTDPRH